jgi:hypothetical protein
MTNLVASSDSYLQQMDHPHNESMGCEPTTFSPFANIPFPFFFWEKMAAQG